MVFYITDRSAGSTALPQHKTAFGDLPIRRIPKADAVRLVRQACAAGIDIPQAARMSALLRRSPYQRYMTDEWYQKMHRIENCVHCDACKSRCPYGLDTPNLLVEMLKDYDGFYAEHHADI